MSEHNNQEPEYWQWRIKTDRWSIDQIYRSELYVTSDNTEVRKLYTAPLDAQAIRRKALEDCLVQVGMTAAYTEYDGNAGRVYDEIADRIQALIDKEPT